MTIRTILAAACCAAVTLPAAAEAATTYRLDATGTGSYLLDIDLSGEDHTETSRVDATFAWRSFIPAVRFDDEGRVIGVVETPAEPTVLTGQLKRSIRHLNDDYPDHNIVIDCEGADVRDAGMGYNAVHGVDGHPTAVVFEPFHHVEFLDHKCSNGMKEPFGIFDDGGDPHGIWQPDEHGEFDQVFELPREAIGQGRIVQFVKPLSGQTIPAQCPSYSQEPGQRCTSRLEWSGSITLTKISEDEIVAPLVPPPTAPSRIDAPPAPPVAPQPAPKPPVADDDLIAPLVLPGAKVDPAGRTVSFKAGCATGCAGTATITTRGGGSRASSAKRARPLAKLRFRVRAGAPRTIRLRVPAAARSRLRRARRATIAIVLEPTGGGPARRTTRSLTLPKR